MKRFVSAALVVAILFSLFLCPIAAFAEEQNSGASDFADVVEDYLSFSCVYNDESKDIVVSGSMKHEALAHFKNSKLLIYAVPPGMSELQVVKSKSTKPLAETDASLEFGFTFKLKKFIDRYSRYAIFLRSEDGEMTLATEPQYPETEANVKKDKNRFKGIATASATIAADVGAETVIFPVFLDSLFTENTSGYSYTVDGKQVFFDKGRVNDLDSKINSLSPSEPKIYLQFLLKDNGKISEDEVEKIKYCMPDMRDEHTLLLVHSAVSFLVSRYENEAGAGIDGIIMGKSWNSPAVYNYCKYDSIREYVELCGLYTVAVANAARNIKPSVDVVVPFSDENFNKEAKFSFDVYTNALFEYFDNSFYSGISCSVMMESNQIPFGITNDNIEGGVDIDFDNYKTEIHPGGQKAFSDYLISVSKKYNSAPKDYMFCLYLPEELYGNALDAVYAYSYFALISDSAVSSFVIDITDRTNDSLDVVKYIDTDRRDATVGRLLRYFGAERWSKIKGITKSPASTNKTINGILPLSALPSSVKGSFNYFDFSDSLSSIDGWRKGTGCVNIRLDYTQNSIRALKAELLTSSTEKSEIVYLYDDYDNMSYAPYLKFDFQINDGAEDSLYEIKFVFENDGNRYESSYAARGDELTEVVLNLSGYKHVSDIRNMKISVRCLYGDVENCTLWLHDIKGYSDKYDSATLERLIDKEREKADVSEEEEDGDSSIEAITIALGLFLIAGTLGFGLFVIFKRDIKNTSDDE